ncbi:MAG: alkaline phosphatase family protein [Bacteroidetes bacterium]|nr:alkaline phosphatase family protein [Bacteroidota bacterium]
MTNHFFSTFIKITLLLQLFINLNVLGETPKTKLAVIIVVDQMRYDYLIRYAGYFDSGISNLLSNGAYFTEAYHDHAFTATAPGHATIATGCFPSKHGIVLNDYYDHSSKRVIYSCADDSSKIIGHPDLDGLSPIRLLRTGISDWLKKNNSKSKIYCVSLKDRPSIMMGGQNPDGVFWYDDNSGTYVTSEYYMNSYPAWVDSFNLSGSVLKHFGDDWEKHLNEDSYLISREDDFPFENTRVGNTFPHKLKKDENDKKSFFKLFPYSPFGEEFNFDFAKSIIKYANLGNDENPDLLFIGCSSGDKLGHDFGPLSQEMQDYYLWLDKYIGEFLKYLDENVGKNNYVLAFSADHGTATVSEELQRKGYDSKRIPYSEVKKNYAEAVEKAEKMLGLKNSILIKSASNGMILNYAEADEKNIPRADLRKAVADALKNISFVADTYTIEELNNSGGKEYLENYKNNFLPERSYEILIRAKKYYTINHDNYGVNHGSPYDYDSHVPIVFYGPGIIPGKYNNRVSTVDIVPTLAEFLGINFDKNIDGKSLLKIISK